MTPVDSKLLARIGAIVFVAIAITMTAIEMSRPPEPAGASDPDCLRAWAENRRRFLAPGARPAARIADAATPQEN